MKNLTMKRTLHSQDLEDRVDRSYRIEDDYRKTGFGLQSFESGGKGEVLFGNL